MAREKIECRICVRPPDGNPDGLCRSCRQANLEDAARQRLIDLTNENIVLALDNYLAAKGLIQ